MERDLGMVDMHSQAKEWPQHLFALSSMLTLEQNFIFMPIIDSMIIALTNHKNVYNIIIIIYTASV